MNGRLPIALAFSLWIAMAIGYWMLAFFVLIPLRLLKRTSEGLSKFKEPDWMR